MVRHLKLFGIRYKAEEIPTGLSIFIHTFFGSPCRDFLFGGLYE